MSPEPIVIVDRESAVAAPAGRRRRVIGLIAIGLAGLGALAFATSGPSGESFSVRRGNIIHSLAARGRVEAESTLEILPKIEARIEQIHVKEGDPVKAGQILVTLQGAELRARLAEATRAAEAARARRAEMERGTRPEELERIRARVKEAESLARAAEATHAELERGARPETREEAEARLESAKIEAECAERDWNRIRPLFESGIASERESDDAMLRHRKAQATLREAQAQRDRTILGATEEERKRSQATMEAARARLEQARAECSQLTTGATTEERAAMEAECRQAEAVATRLEAEAAHLTITAPSEGVVLRRYREPSELVSPLFPKPILVLAASPERQIRIEIQEQDVYKIAVGRKMRVTADAFPGSSWGAEVKRLAPVMGRKNLSSDNPKERTDVKVMEAWLTFDEKRDLPFSLPVDVRMTETVRSNVLVLPARALSRDGTVRLKDGSTKPVETGLRDDTFVEILTGLAEGDDVLLGE